MDEATVEAPHPVRLAVADDLHRSRLTVFFRLLLAVPHFVWILLWSIAASFAAIANWFATLVTGVPPRALHRFLSAYVRYAIHVYAFVALTGNPFPGFVGARGSYPVDVELDPPERQNRWTVAFRAVLAIPSVAIVSSLTGGSNYNGNVLATTAFFGWFASLVRARMPEGFHDAQVYSLRYAAQTWAYLFVLTDRYPNSDPTLERERPAREHPIGLVVEDDLRRSRLTVFFRLLLAIPHLLWWSTWGSVVPLTLIAAWFAALVTGESPASLHQFHAAYLRYQTQVFAYLGLVANQFPGFLADYDYPVNPAVEPRARQNRWTVGFRLILAIPAGLLMVFVLWALLATVAFLGWFAALVLGRMPLGLRNAGAYVLRYSAQTYGYLYLLTDRYPFSGPPA